MYIWNSTLILSLLFIFFTYSSQLLTQDPRTHLEAQWLLFYFGTYA